MRACGSQGAHGSRDMASATASVCRTAHIHASSTDAPFAARRGMAGDGKYRLEAHMASQGTRLSAEARRLLAPYEDRGGSRFSGLTSTDAQRILEVEPAQANVYFN